MLKKRENTGRRHKTALWREMALEEAVDLS
jgi:hypothetical protein